MSIKETTGMTLMAGTATAAVDSAAVNEALETLKSYDWGADRNALKPIDQAIVAARGNAAALKPLEKKLVDALTSGISRSAQDYVCRKLRVIGTSQSVRALTALIADEETSHIARFALECIPDRRAVKAIRDALLKVDNKLKPGMIGSLGARRDRRSVQAVSKHLKVLEAAGLVSRRREAQRRPVHLEAETFGLMLDWIQRYERQAERRFQRLDAVLTRMSEDENSPGVRTPIRKELP